MNWNNLSINSKLVIYLLFSCQPSFLIAQTLIQPEQFLTQQITAFETSTSSTQNTTTFMPSWIEEVQFRTETQEFDLELQQYVLRAAPNSPKVRQAQIRLHELYQQQANSANLKAKADIIESAYQDLLEVYVHHHALQLKQELLVLLNDQEKVLIKLSQINSRYLDDWMGIIVDIQETQLDSASHANSLQQLLPKQQQIDWNNWITIAEISNNLQKGSSSLSGKQQLLKQQLVDGEIALEQAEAKRIFDFFQIEYQGSNADPFREKVSLTAAFQFPFSSNRKLKIEELLMEKAALEEEHHIKNQLQQNAIKKKRQQLEQQIQQWHLSKKLLDQLKEKSQRILQAQSYQTKEGPLATLLYKVLLKEKELDLFDLETGIYKDYLMFLVLTKNILRPPYRAFQAP